MLIKVKGALMNGVVTEIIGQVSSITKIRRGKVHLVLNSAGDEVELFANTTDIIRLLRGRDLTR